MNPQIKERWIAALLSGMYVQTRSALCRKNDKGEESFCAVGVLCELYRQDHTNSSWCVPWCVPSCHALQLSDQMVFSTSSQTSVATAPILVREWAEVSLDDLCRVDFRNDIGDYSQFPRHPYSFAELAEYIKHNL